MFDDLMLCCTIYILVAIMNWKNTWQPFLLLRNNDHPTTCWMDNDYAAAAAAPPPYYFKQSILFLTDDATVIDEGLTKYPQYSIYIRRPRFKGPEGGFEYHIPSADPTLELLVLLSLFHFISRHCTRGVIHTMSNLGKYLAVFFHSPYQHDHDRYNTTIINLETGLNTSDISMPIILS
jgi:hypothetical protein